MQAGLAIFNFFFLNQINKKKSDFFFIYSIFFYLFNFFNLFNFFDLYDFCLYFFNILIFYHFFSKCIIAIYVTRYIIFISCHIYPLTVEAENHSPETIYILVQVDLSVQCWLGYS